jgi:hypothetical protein
MGHSQNPSDSRWRYGCIAVILLTLGVDIGLVLAIFLLAHIFL